MRFLLLNILSFFIVAGLTSCAATPYKNLPKLTGAPPLALTLSLDKKLLYTASVDIYNHHINGLIALKKMKGGEIRIAFLAQSAIKLVEFRCNEDKCNPSFIMDKIEGTGVVERLQEDFHLLLMKDVALKEAKVVLDDSNKNTRIYRFGRGTRRVFYSVNKKSGHVTKIEKRRNNRLVVSINLSNYNSDGVPLTIVIQREKIKVDMKLVVWD
ncbi:hypothetical protein KAH37_07750 [bacterium]|nr:hypothetical protein [bacterium]